MAAESMFNFARSASRSSTSFAGQTKKLKLAECGVCLPDWHPIRAAEDVAMLDHMSKGRVEFGALAGVNNRVNGNFNRNADRRNQKVSRALYWETLEIMQLAWKGEPFKFKGEFYELPMDDDRSRCAWLGRRDWGARGGQGRRHRSC